MVWGSRYILLYLFLLQKPGLCSQPLKKWVVPLIPLGFFLPTRRYPKWYPPGKIIFNSALVGDMLVPRKIKLFIHEKWWPNKHFYQVILLVTFFWWPELKGGKRDLQRSGIERSRLESPDRGTQKPAINWVISPISRLFSPHWHQFIMVSMGTM